MEGPGRGDESLSELGETPDNSLNKGVSKEIRTVAKGGAIQIFGQVSQRGLSFIFQLVAVAFVGRPAYGVYKQISQVLAIAAQIALAGFNYASMRFITIARAEGKPEGVKGAARVGIGGAVVGSVIVVACLVVFAEPLASQFADEPADESMFIRLFRIGAPYVPLFALLQVLRYCTQAYKTMTPSVVSGMIVQPVVRFVVGLFVLLIGFEVAGLITTLNVSILAATLVAAFFFARMLTEEERAARPRAPVGPMVKFALPQGGSSLLGIQSLGLGILVVGVYGTDVQVAIFALALSLQGPGTVFLGGILNIWAPVVSDLHAKGQIEELDKLYKVITRWVATFSFPVWAALIVMPYVFVDLFVPASGEGIPSVVAILAVGNFFYTGTGPTGYVLSMTGRPWVNLINSMVAVVLYVIAGAWAVPRYGPNGMAVVDGAVTALINIVRVVEAKVLVGVQPFGRPILKPIGATAVGAFVLLLWRWIPGYNVWVDAAGIVVAGLVYLLVLRAFGMDPEEREVWERIKKRVKRKRGRS